MIRACPRRGRPSCVTTRAAPYARSSLRTANASNGMASGFAR